MIKEIRVSSLKPPTSFDGRFAMITGDYIKPNFKSAMKIRRTRFEEEIARNRATIEANIDAFEKYFAGGGYPCPLRSQFQRAAERGLPSRSLIVDSLLYLELTSGLLMGVQDASKFLGTTLQISWAKGGERIDGFAGVLTCSSGEPIVCDEMGVIASVFQGPDARVNVDEYTTDLAFFVFDAPSLQGGSFDEALANTVSLLEDASGSPVTLSTSY